MVFLQGLVFNMYATSLPNSFKQVCKPNAFKAYTTLSLTNCYKAVSLLNFFNQTKVNPMRLKHIQFLYSLSLPASLVNSMMPKSIDLLCQKHGDQTCMANDGKIHKISLPGS
jgi:hypothetical protein